MYFEISRTYVNWFCKLAYIHVRKKYMSIGLVPGTSLYSIHEEEEGMSDMHGSN